MIKRIFLYLEFTFGVFKLYYFKHSIFLILKEIDRITYFHKYRSEFQNTEIFLINFTKQFQKFTKKVNLVRVGPQSDSGYFISKSPNNYSHLISGGIGKNIDFEYEFAIRNIPVYVFDPTIERLPRSHKNITWIKKFISDSTAKNSVDFEQFLSSFYDKNNILIKLDIEGDEYKVLDKVLSFSPDEIVIEIHDTFKLVDPVFRNNFDLIFKKIFSNYYIIHSHGNNNGHTNVYGSIIIPDILELTLLRKNIKFKRSVDNIRFSNYTNNPSLPEIISIPYRIFEI
jgi:hypothetical protein